MPCDIRNLLLSTDSSCDVFAFCSGWWNEFLMWTTDINLVGLLCKLLLSTKTSSEQLCIGLH